MEIRNLEHTDFETIFHGFKKAFADYEIHFEKEEVRSMLKRRGYNPQLSFAAFDNDEIVAFTLNGMQKTCCHSGICCSTMMPLPDVPDWSPTTSTHGWICIPGWRHCTLKNPTGAETWENGSLIKQCRMPPIMVSNT